ncbi:MAG TPA: hypothetical protein VHL58_14380 [Thermoanaerobaculia bacterium]|nr:hypothetical protein [Thermoanaerobaculia bacterium]
MLRRLLTFAGILLFTTPLFAQTADDIIAKFVKTVGGMEKIKAVTTLRRVGKYSRAGGFEAKITQENKRPDKVRQDFMLQGMDGITAWDGKTGWKIEPWDGKKDPEPLGEEELKSIIEDSDLDGPLVNYRQKGNKVEYVGMEPVEGTDAYKLKVTLASGDTRYYYMDTDYYVPIKIESTLIIRGAERTYESSLGDYKEVAGWYLPFSIEVNTKGSPNRQKYTYERIEANVPIAEERFKKPSLPTNDGKPMAPDAADKQPEQQQKKEEKKPPVAALQHVASQEEVRGSVR